MKIISRILITAMITSLAASSARAVYAPIPDVEKGRLLTLYLEAGTYYDTNIFGSPADNVESQVFQLQPTAVFNMSASNTTFLTGSYKLSLDYFDNRPGDKMLDSHSLFVRAAHMFSPRFEGEFSDAFQIQKNPATLMPGVAAASIPDQSYTYNQFDGKVRYNIDPRNGLKGKLRVSNFWYDNSVLADALDHDEWLIGLEWVRLARKELQACAEVRFRAVRYATEGNLKDKDSYFLLAGADYVVGRGLAFSGRLGGEALQRKDGGDDLLPYVELGVKQDWRDRGFISGGYTVSVQESSNIHAYTDMYVHRFFVNAQRLLAKNITLAGAFDWQPGRLNGREHVAADINEDAIKAGVSLTFSTSRHWSFSFTCDYDKVNSEDPNRELERTRLGISGRWVF